MITFKFRPHHLLCSLCFRGKGYNEAFIQNFKAIYNKLTSKPNPDAAIQIIEGCDDICKKCPQQQNNLCDHEHKASAIDNAYLEILQFKSGQTITFECLKAKVKERLTMDDFQKACGSCSWYPLNMCAPIVRELIRP